jgi:hypothetical protein
MNWFRRFCFALPLRLASLGIVLTSVLFDAAPSWVSLAQSASNTESLNGLISRRRLNPPLRSADVLLKYSPDGQYLLLQDPLVIYVLSRQPLKMLGTISAPNSHRISISPDSQSVNLLSFGLSFERWGLQSGNKIDAKELPVHDGCVSAQLSPSGELLACYRPDFSLGILKISTGEWIFSQELHAPDPQFRIVPISIDLDTAFAGPFGFYLSHDLKPLANRGLLGLPMTFSADSQAFIAIDSVDAVAIDLATRKKMRLPAVVQKHLTGALAMQRADRVLAIAREHPEDPAILSLASGDVLTRPAFKADSVRFATNPRYVLLSDRNLPGMRVFDLDENRSVDVPANIAADVSADEVALATELGDIVLYHLHEPQPIGTIRLPLSALPHLRSATVAPDLDRLALAVDAAGGFFQLATGARLSAFPRFLASGFLDASNAFLLLPRHRATPPAVLRLDTATAQTSPAWSGGKELLHAGGAVLWEYSMGSTAGRLVYNSMSRLVIGTQDSAIPFRLRALDPASGKELWSRSFDNDPPIPFADPQGDRLILSWKAKSESAFAAAKHDLVAKELLKKAKLSDHDSFLQALDARTGTSLGGVLVQTGAGPLNFDSVFSEGQAIIFSRDDMRTYLYSLKDGQLKTRLLGSRPSASAQSNLLALIEASGRLGIYDLNAGAKLDEQVFPDSLAYTHFSADGNRLFVLTEFQYAFVLDIRSVRERHPPADASSGRP